MKKTISADHSGGAVKFDAVTNRKVAEEYAKSLKDMFTPSDPRAPYDYTYSVKCNPRIETFLNGGKSLHCEWRENCINSLDIEYIDTREGTEMFYPDRKEDIDIFRVNANICPGDLLVRADNPIDPRNAYYARVTNAGFVHYVDVTDIEKDIDESDLFGREDD